MMLFRRFSRSLLTACRHYQRTAVRYKNLDGDYIPTSLSMVDDEESDLLFIEAMSPIGFRLHNKVRVFGPLALFPKSVFQWNIAGVEDINEESLSLFTILVPKIDILVLGLGDRGKSISPSVLNYLRSKNITVEFYGTEQAISTFNFLNAEKRYVAAGLIPPSIKEFRESMLSQSWDNIPLEQIGQIDNMKLDFDNTPKITMDEFKKELHDFKEGLHDKMTSFRSEKEVYEKREGEEKYSFDETQKLSYDDGEISYQSEKQKTGDSKEALKSSDKQSSDDVTHSGESLKSSIDSKSIPGNGEHDILDSNKKKER